MMELLNKLGSEFFVILLKQRKCSLFLNEYLGFADYV